MAAKKKVRKTKAPVAKKTKAPAPQSSFSISPRIWLIIVLAITFVAFIPSLQNDFVNWDDDVNLYENPNLERFDAESIRNIFSDDVIGNYNPLPIFTFALERHFFGLNPTVFHITNLILHLLCVWLVFLLLQQWKLSTFWSGIGALWFGVHPMRVESVAWITERKDVLFGVFFLGALYLYGKWVKSDKHKALRYGLITLLFILSLLSKIQAVALPLAMLCVDYWLKRPISWKLIWEKIPFFALSLATGLLGIYMLQEQGSIDTDNDLFGLVDRIFIAGFSLLTYLYKLIIPYPLSPLYPYPASIQWFHYASILVPIGLVAALVWSFKKQPVLFFGLSFFLVNVVFVLQIVGAGQAYLADRFTYIAYLGLFFMLAYYGQSLVKGENPWSTGPGWVALGSIGIFSIMTFFQTQIWENGEVMWSHVIKHHPDTPLPWGNRGFYRRTQGRYEQAIADFTEAISLKPDNPGYYNSKGKCLFDMGESAQAVNEFTNAIKYDDTNSEYFVNRGGAFASLNMMDKALQDFNWGVEKGPNNPNAYLNRSLLFVNRGQYAQAKQDYDRYIEIDPYNPEIWFERALVKRLMQQYREALIDINQAIDLKNDDFRYYFERARLYKVVGNLNAMQADIQQGIALGGTAPTDL